MDEPPKPHLHVRSVEGSLLSDAVAITGNAHALLRLRAQIDRALRGEDSYPFEEGVYHDVHGTPFEVAVKAGQAHSAQRAAAQFQGC